MMAVTTGPTKVGTMDKAMTGLTVTREQWETHEPQSVLGGDFWNTDMVWRKVFRAQDVVSATRERLSSGLYVDVRLSLDTGETIKRRLYS